MPKATAASRTGGITPVVVYGFGITVAMWAVGYLCRLPVIMAPAPVLFAGLLIALLAGGYLAGRGTGSARTGALAGLLSSCLNLLVLGSLLTDPDRTNHVELRALYTVPGFLIAGAVFGGLGALAGAKAHRAEREDDAFAGKLAVIAGAATFLLVVAGGLTTGAEAGMDVPDWPQSFGYNMFLYPLSRMTGGVYYEHAHRLFGTLVGLTMLVLALLVVRREKGRTVKALALTVFIMVVIQGMMGGFRVTEDSIWLAIIHGVFGQVIFALVLTLAAMTSATWRGDAPPREARGAKTDKILGFTLFGFLVLQIFLGAMLRQIEAALHPHITVAAVVFFLGMVTGFRAWGLYGDLVPLRRAGTALITLLVLQVVMGIVALAVAGATRGQAVRPISDVLLTTVHQAIGALLLATAALIGAFASRLLRQGSEAVKQ
jgi:cytochrome c oxidase assembly protein subunit 15